MSDHIKKLLGAIKGFPFIAVTLLLLILKEHGFNVLWEKVTNNWYFVALFLIGLVLYFMSRGRFLFLKVFEFTIAVMVFVLFYRCNLDITLVFTSAPIMYDLDSQLVDVCFKFKNRLPYRIPDVRGELDVNHLPVDESKGKLQINDYRITYYRNCKSPWDFGNYIATVRISSILSGERQDSMRFTVGFVEKFDDFPGNLWSVEPMCFELDELEDAIILTTDSNQRDVCCHFREKFLENILLKFRSCSMTSHSEKRQYNIIVYLNRDYAILIGDGDDKRIALKRIVRIDKHTEQWNEISSSYLRDGMCKFDELQIEIAVYYTDVLNFDINIAGAGRVIFTDTSSAMISRVKTFKPGIGVLNNDVGMMFKDICMRNLTTQELCDVRKASD